MIITYFILKKYGYYERVKHSAQSTPLDVRLSYLFIACTTLGILLLIPLILAA